MKFLLRYPKTLIAILLAIAMPILLWYWFTPRFPEEIQGLDKAKQTSVSPLSEELAQTLTSNLRLAHGHLTQETFTPANEKESALLQHYYRKIDESRLIETCQDLANIQGFKMSFKKLASTPPIQYTFTFSQDQIVQLRFQAQLDEYGQGITNSIVQKPAIPLPGKPRLVLILDDVGQNYKQFLAFAELEPNITFSMLPHLPYTQKSAAKAAEMGLETMLHMPMQPIGWPEVNPGTGALMVDEKITDSQSKLEAALAQVPQAKGINNHMGSAFVQNEPGMAMVMGKLAESKMFFLDSRTAPGDIARNLAEQKGVIFLERDIFLDNERSIKIIEDQLQKAANLALKRGLVIAIFHPYPETLQALRLGLPEVKKKGVRIQRISRVVEGMAASKKTTSPEKSSRTKPGSAPAKGKPTPPPAKGASKATSRTTR